MNNSDNSKINCNSNNNRSIASNDIDFVDDENVNDKNNTYDKDDNMIIMKILTTIY